MYSVLFVSPDRSFLAQAQKFLPNLDRDIGVITATDMSSAANILKDGTIVDVVVFAADDISVAVMTPISLSRFGRNF